MKAHQKRSDNLNCKEFYIPSNGKIFVRYLQAPFENNMPPIILIPGGPGADSTVYHRHVPLFLKHCNVILFDPMDTGKSDKGIRNIERDAHDLEAIRQFFNLRKWTLFGASYGGILAQFYALKYQQYLEKLILAVTTPSFHFLKQAKQEIRNWKDSECVLQKE